MRISDWSLDVCSSDLGRGDDGRLHGGSRAGFIGREAPVGAALAAIGGLLASAQRLDAVVGGVDLACAGIGLAAQFVRAAGQFVRVELGDQAAIGKVSTAERREGKRV